MEEIKTTSVTKEKSFWLRLLCGYGIGFAFIVPGISGSAIAMLFGIYEEMIGAVSDIFKKFKKSVLFLLPIFLGVGLAVASMIKLITYCLEKQTFITILLFVGFILGGLKPMLKKANFKTAPKKYYLFFALTFAIAVSISCIKYIDGGHVDLINVSNIKVKQYSMMVLVGIIFAISMVLPGVSGSTLLISMGYYTPVFDMVTEMLKQAIHFDFTWQYYVLSILLVAGVVIGMLAMSNIMKKAFEKYPIATYIAVCGLAIGSIPAIFIAQTWKGDAGILPFTTLEILGGILTLAVGFFVAYLFVYLQEKQEKKNALNNPMNIEN